MGRLKWHIVPVFALVAFAFSGMAAGEQFYVDEGGWWRDGDVFNVSGTPIQGAVDTGGQFGSAKSR